MTFPSAAEIEQILALGRSVLDPNLQSEQLLMRLEAFIDAISAIPLDGELSGDQRDSLTRITELHAAVLAHAATLQGNWSKGLADLRRRSKGIMAYADQLPKRLSSRPSKKS